MERILLDGVEIGLTKYAKQEDFNRLIEQNILTQYFVDSVDKMTDTSKAYVLKSTGTIWEYKENIVTKKEITVIDKIEGTEDNPYYDNARLSSSATEDTVTRDITGYMVTPIIDLTAYSGKRIKLHLEGLQYFTEESVAYTQTRTFGSDKKIIVSREPSATTGDNTWAHIKNAEIKIESDTSTVITADVPLLYSSSSTEVWYLRFGAKGVSSDSDIYVEYTKEEISTEGQWIDTGILFGYILGGDTIGKEAYAKILGLNNEGADAIIIKLLPQPVLEFYNSDDYPDDDYTSSHIEKITYPYRADLPVPYTVKWSHNEKAMRTTVAMDTKPIGTNNQYSMKVYDATGFDNYPLYNLMPNKTYYYKVTHVLDDGSLVEAKSGNFTTSNESIRLLYIDGTQNVRDLGGWTGLGGKKVKYGKIIRGASFADSSYHGLMLTGKGRLALAELKIQAELNLGAIDNKTSIAPNCSYKKLYYTSYATAITDSAYRTMFKTILEYIVSCLNGTLETAGLNTVERNIYMHCQGGCDRTGTLSFLLLGLLGVSESDLAKEYELSSFSDIGFGRLRTTTKAVDVYDYAGMVEALKKYSGDTITDKFYNFATAGCGISEDIITKFRNNMLI